MHPVDAVHGDLGMVVRGDVVLALSASGETEEILRLLATLKRLQVPLISMTGDAVFDKNRGRVVRDHTINYHNKIYAGTLPRTLHWTVRSHKEACWLGLAPTASTTAMLALGDGLAMALAEKRGFKEEDFANLHPGGKLGKRLAGSNRSCIPEGCAPGHAANQNAGCDLRNVAQEAGCDGGSRGEKLMGVISDGDLRRLLEKRGKDVSGSDRRRVHDREATNNRRNEFAATALALMEEKKITSLVVVDSGRHSIGNCPPARFVGNGDDVAPPSWRPMAGRRSASTDWRDTAALQ